MATNFDGLRKTREILTTLLARMRALELDVALPGGPTVREKAFERVELFMTADLRAAMKRLLLSQQRFALVVYEGKSFESDVAGSDLVIKQTRRLMIIVSDRNMADEEAALLGALDLADLVEEEIPGLLLANPKGVYVEADSDEPLMVSDDKQKEIPGRRAIVVNCTIVGGLLTKDLEARGSRGPIQ